MKLEEEIGEKTQQEQLELEYKYELAFHKTQIAKAIELLEENGYKVEKDN